MKARAVCGLAALTLVVSSACEITRPGDLHPDVVVLSLLLVAGEREARMLALHPHRERDDPAPSISASLVGPGWTAAFSDAELEPWQCDTFNNWIDSPATCLNAWLPEAIQPGMRYRLVGTAPLGSFTGEATLPAVPVLVEPADTLLLSLPEVPGDIGIPLRYEVDSETGTVLAELVFTNSGRRIGYTRVLVDIAGADTVEVYQIGDPQFISLSLLGVGWNYTNFIKHTGSDLVLPPWPSFGIEGEGVYGYFDGFTTPSRTAYILVR